MGNASLKRSCSQSCRRDQEEDKKDLSLLELKDIWRLHLCCSHDLLLGFPLILPHYHEEGTMMMLNAALKEVAIDIKDSQFGHVTSPLIPRLAPKPGVDFVKTQRRKMINGIQRLDTLLEILLTDGILNPTNLDVINIYAVQNEKKRILVDLVLRKGDMAQELFYKALSQSQSFLLENMEHSPIVDKVCILYL